ncbi:MAG: nuclear transport factor 2 family protein [Gammaproteobacteria bacterium]|nr:nuclear transport factor 2 family protein [Gammaproteobacteria bacterium]MDH5802277.1 nuclear transport factor 2 family protein [Gammaproteobacteria bacterium]
MKKLFLLLLFIFSTTFAFADSTSDSTSDSTVGLSGNGSASTQSVSAPHEQDRAALKQILKEIEAAINAMDFEGLFKHFDENISVNFMTNDIAVGKEAIIAFYNKLFKDEGAILQSHKTTASLGAPAVFHDNTITAYGMARDTFELKDGTIHHFDTRWTASAVKKNDQWKVVSLHFSVSPFANPILEQLTGKLGLFSVVAFAVGIIIAFFIARFGRRSTT